MALEDSISKFVEKARFSDLTEKVIHEAKRRIIDSIGVSLASISSPPAKAMRRMLPYFQGDALLIGGGTASPDAAAFYNTLLIRYLDFNDTYLSREPLHPSDMIGALLAVGSIEGSSCEDLILSIAVGYEIGTRLCDSASLRSKGYDHVNYLEIATAAALSKMLNFDREKAVNAISMSLVPNIALRESRVGELSMWKAGAAADASRNSAFAALATKKGFTSPSRPLSGQLGFMRIVCNDLDTTHFDGMGKPRAILRTYIKKYPVEYHAQSAVDMSIRLSKRIGSRKVKDIQVETYEAGKTILADPEKWRPRNRETADHSLPFTVSAAIQEGDFWLGTYSLVGKSGMDASMRKVQVIEREDYTTLYAETLPTRVVVQAGGEKFEEEMSVPKGHWKNPLTDAELETKFIRLTNRRKLIDALWDIEGTKVSHLVKSTKQA